MKDEWQKIKGKWHKSLGPKHEKLYVGKETICYKSIKCSVELGKKENEFLRSQMCSEIQSQVVGFRRVLHNREAQQEHISQSFHDNGTQEAK